MVIFTVTGARKDLYRIGLFHCASQHPSALKGSSSVSTTDSAQAAYRVTVSNVTLLIVTNVKLASTYLKTENVRLNAPAKANIGTLQAPLALTVLKVVKTATI